MKIAAVVVTYNRLNFLRKNLGALCRQSRRPDKIIVVDNASTDGTKDFLSTLSKDCNIVKVIRLNENIGGSGGFSLGLKEAMKNGADWAWMMDDDAIPYIDALSELEKAAKNAGVSIGVLLSKITERKDTKKIDLTVPALSGTFVGFAVRKEAVKSAGYPDASFFIYADDYDYSVRIRKAGFSIMRVNSSLIFHKDWARQNKVLKFPFIKPDIPSWKTYYIIRNTLNATRHIWVFHVAVRFYLFFDRFVWSYVNPKTKTYVFKGFRDGVKGIKGKTVSPAVLNE